MNTSFEVNRKTTTTTWLTPLHLIHALGEFDLDPCTPEVMPWLTAKNRFTEKDNGLIQPWFGRVWMNPPYGREMEAFFKKMVEHGNGIALTFSRTETLVFEKYIWNHADAVLFKTGRIHFLNNEGQKSGNGSGNGSLFIAYGKSNADALQNSGIRGKFIRLIPQPL